MSHIQLFGCFGAFLGRLIARSKAAVPSPEQVWRRCERSVLLQLCHSWDSTSPLNDDFPYGLINPKQLFNIYLIRGIVKVSCYHISSLFGELLIWKLPVKWGKALVKPPWSSHWIPRRCQGLSWIAGRINVATWDQKRTSGTGTRWDEVFAASVSRVPGSSYTHQTLGAKPWKIVRLSKT